MSPQVLDRKQATLSAVPTRRTSLFSGRNQGLKRQDNPICQYITFCLALTLTVCKKKELHSMVSSVWPFNKFCLNLRTDHTVLFLVSNFPIICLFKETLELSQYDMTIACFPIFSVLAKQFIIYLNNTFEALIFR